NYVVAFLGALQARLAAVPLSVPLGGVSDERVSSVLRDALPSVVLTTSAVVDNVAEYMKPEFCESAPSVVQVDLLYLDAPRRPARGGEIDWGMAYLQYTSGSTRTPAGVMVTHRNVMTNLTQLISDTFEDLGRVPPPDTTVVSWLPFYHD